MSFKVVKAFKSVNRKFKPGDTVVASDIDPGSVFSLEDWVARGFVKSDAPVPQPSAKQRSGAAQKQDAE